MGRTPDFFPGQRLEESIRFLSGTSLPSEHGVMAYVSGANAVSGSGLYLSEEGVPVGPFRKLINSESHARLRQLIHLADVDGPFEGFGNAVKDTDTGVFSTGSIWFTNSGRTKKIIDKTITRNGILPTQIIWNAYDTDGVTVLTTATDVISYSGVFESSRTRYMASPTSVFTLGDSQTVGASGYTGGWRARMLTPITWVGPFVDAVGLNHAGRDGDRLVDATSNDMIDRFASQWAATPSDEVWVTGGVNDMLGGQSAAQTATDLGTLLDTIISTVSASTIIRVGSPAPLSTSTSASLDTYWRSSIAQVIATKRASGALVFFHHAGSQISYSALDGDPGHPNDTEYGADGYGLWAEWQDRWLNDESISPDELSLEAWFKADTDYNSSTGEWLDQSGNGRDANPTGAAKPTVVTGQFGVTALRFASSPLRTTTGWSLSQPNTILVVMSSISGSGSPGIFDGADISNRHAMIIAPTTGVPSFYAGSSVVPDAALNMQTIGHLALIEFNGSQSKWWLDGNPRSQGLGTLGTHSLGGLTIGGSSAATPTNLLTHGDIYEIAVFSGTLTEDERFGLAHYCRSRYGLWPLIGEVTSW